MFEARIKQGGIIKSLVDAVKELVTEANFDCSGGGITVQAMDSSHVSLVSLMLRSDGFEHYRCDRNLTLGMSMASLAKILKCSDKSDSITIKAEDNGDVCTYMFENESTDRISDFELKLMDIDSEHLGIPDTEYQCVVQMPSKEFKRICNDLGQLGDTITLAVTKDGIKFSSSGDTGSGSVLLKQNTSVDKEGESVIIELQEPVNLTFALRYLNHFAKAEPLSDSVSLSLSADVPLLVEYKLEDLGFLRYYLAPKIEDDE